MIQSKPDAIYQSPRRGAGAAASAAWRATALAIAGWATLFAGMPSAAVAWQPPAAGASTPSDATIPTVEGVQERISQLASRADLDADAKKDLQAIDEQALARLQEAKGFQARFAAAEQLRVDGPLELARLGEPVAETKIEFSDSDSRQQLELRLAEARANLQAAQSVKSQIDADAAALADGRSELPRKLSAARSRLEAATGDLKALGASEAVGDRIEAQRWEAGARRLAAEAEIRALDAELSTYDLRSSLLAARRDNAARKVAEADRVVKAWTDAVDARLAADRSSASQQADAARRTAMEAARSAPALKQLAEENLRLAERRTGPSGLLAKIDETKRQLGVAAQRLGQVTADKQLSASRREEAVPEELGAMLRRQRATLPDPGRLSREISALESQRVAARVEQWKLETDRDALNDTDARISSILAELDPSMLAEQREEVKAQARTLLEERRKLIEQLLSDIQSYVKDLEDLINAKVQLKTEVELYRKRIDEQVLWIRSAPDYPLTAADREQAAEAARWLFSPASWQRLAARVLDDGSGRRLVSIGAIVPVLLLVVLQVPMRRRLQQLSEDIGRVTKDRFSFTIAGLVLTLLLALPWPLLLGLLAWRVRMAGEGEEFATAVATGLARCAIVTFVLMFAVKLCSVWGVGRTHFLWSERTMRLVRRVARWMAIAALPLVFVVGSLEVQSVDARRQSLGRATFIFGMIALTVLTQQLVRPRGGLMGPLIAKQPGGWLDRLRILWYPALVGMPLAMGVLAALGYFYSATSLLRRLEATLLMIGVVVMASAVVLRWLVVAQRRLALDQARKRRAAAAEAEAREGGAPKMGGEASVVPEPDLIDVTAISAQSRRLIQTLGRFAVVLGAWLIWADVVPALQRLRDIVIWGSGTDQVNVLSLATAALFLLLTVMAGRNLPGLLEITLLARLPIGAAARYALTTLARYTIFVVGIVLVFNALGVGWSKVQWIAAAVTVGLGFGLQEIFSNFVSGLIILFEQPVRIGDTVTIGETTGTVSRISMRATYITDFDRKEFIVPNRDFVTGRIVNWTLSDTLLRMKIPVGIAYGSDVKRAERILLELARANAGVVAEPSPIVVFTGFGASALNLELRVFIPNLDYMISVRHELHQAIDKSFREAGIVIPFPQQDVNVRIDRGPLPAGAAAEADAAAGRP